MSVIRILGRPNSIAVMKVLVTAEELKLDFNREDYGGKFGYDDFYLKHNPNKFIPTLIDTDGYSIWESHAICKYLARKYGQHTTLYPQDDAQKAGRIDQWMDWHGTSLNPPNITIFWTLVRTLPEGRNLVALEGAKLEALRLWMMLDRQMADGRPFVCGDDFTLADIPMAISAHRWISLVEDDATAEVPNVINWYESLKTRPVLKKIVFDSPLS
jgi:glutathione S-transferase